MSSSPVIILTPPATRDSYEYYYYEYDDEDQEFGQSEKIERKDLTTEASVASEVTASASEVEDQDASGLFFGGIFGCAIQCCRELHIIVRVAIFCTGLCRKKACFAKHKSSATRQNFLAA